MIDAIYTSKLYRTSKRKSAIVSAANSPVNTELITQLADALSPVYRKEEYLVDKKTEEAKAVAEKERAAKESKQVEDTQPENKPDSKPPVEPSHLVDSFRKAQKHEAESQEPVAPPSEMSKSDGEVENSTSVAGASITATRSIVTDMKQVVDEIKSLLNLQETTTGVNRILVKDSELWIYYNDNINLNNVMASAIEVLNAAGYTYLEFNRLARSDNAIVFQILSKDTDAEIKPKSEEDNDEKGN